MLSVEKINNKNALANLYKEMGFEAVANAIIKGDRAKDNAYFALNRYLKDLTSRRFNLETGKWIDPPAEHLEIANKFKIMMTKLIEEVL